MSCGCEYNKKMHNLDHVRILASQCANLTKLDQYIYEVFMYGIVSYRFSATWTGKTVEIVRFNRDTESKTVLRDNELEQPELIDNIESSEEIEQQADINVGANLGTDIGAVLQEVETERLQKRTKKGKPNRSHKK